MSPVSSEVLTKLTGKLRCDRVSVVWAWHPFQTQGVGQWMDIFTKFLWICDQIIKIYLSISSDFGICQNLIFVFSEALYGHRPPPLQTQRVGCWMDILTKIFSDSYSARASRSTFLSAAILEFVKIQFSCF